MSWPADWVYIADTKRDLVARLLRTTKGLTRHRLIKNTLWVLAGEGRKFVGCYRLKKSFSRWGYKAFAEDDHPNDFSCPASFVKEAGEPRTRNALEWRGAVLASKKKVQPGHYAIMG